MRPKRRTAVLLALLLVVAPAVGLLAARPWLVPTAPDPPHPRFRELPAVLEGRGDPVEDGIDFLGHTEDSIVERFGPPTNRYPGWFTPHLDAPEYPYPVSAEYARPAGVRYIAYHSVDGRMLCVVSTWLPKGWVF
jgi:hypothetical protein